MSICAVPGCNEKKRFRFPSNTEVANKWLCAIGRPDLNPKKWEGLCGLHFLPSDFVLESAETGLKLSTRILKRGTVPSQHLNANVAEPPSKKLKRDVEENLPFIHAPQVLVRGEADLGVEPLPVNEDDVVSSGFEGPVLDVFSDGSTVNNDCGKKDMCCGTEEVKLYDVQVQTSSRMAPYTIEDFRHKPKELYHLTGMESFGRFMLVLYSLGPNVSSVQYHKNIVKNVSIADQLFLTLWKLRKRTQDEELAIHFGIHNTAVANIFTSMIKFMSKQWGKLNIWPSRDLVTYYMPDNFNKMYPTTRVIVDGTEVPIEKPTNPRAQQASYSTYKNSNTFKVLVGGSPSGLLTYCSEGYGGSASDRQIVERSSLLHMCDSGDSVMADRGFNVQDLFAPKGVAVNIPAFLKGKDNLPSVVIMKDRKLASKRVHIERLIGLAKTYKMISNRMSHHHTPLASEIFYVCVMLCNFRENIISKKA